MKLAEALIERAAQRKRIEELRALIVSNARVQEGDKPALDPAKLLAEAVAAGDALAGLVKRINRTNAVTAFDAGRTLADALADRDRLISQHKLHLDAYNAAAAPQQRFARLEIKFVSALNAAALRKTADSLAQKHRELDLKIQEMNWAVDLLD